MKKRINPKNNGCPAALLKKELRSYEMAGTHLYLEGRRCHANEIVSACIFAGEGGYMRDFIGDDQKKITDINFVKIRL